jgi:MFS family permease
VPATFPFVPRSHQAVMLPSAFNRLSLAGLGATLVGNGIGRFAFIAMVPALIQAGWFTQGEASHLSVATLWGYVLGAWVSDSLAKRFHAATLLRIAMLVCSLSFFAGAIEGAGMAWHYLWRAVAGFCGALLMVLPAPVVLPLHRPEVRGRASGVVFSGIGLGAVLSGLLVPLLVAGIGLGLIVGGVHQPLFEMRGLVGAWLGMGGICLALTLLAWRQWPTDATAPAPAHADALAHPPAPPTPTPTPERAATLPTATQSTLRLIWAAHGLNAVGYLAHTLFWVDYIVRELGMPLATGGFLWAMFGLGAAVGPLLTGALADKFGLQRCLIVAFLFKALGAALPLSSDHFLSLLASSLLMGILTPGIASLISAYALDRVGAEHHRQAWGTATFSFAVAQAVGGFLMALAATSLTSYRPLFVVSAVALLGSIVCIAAIAPRSAANSIPDPPEPHAHASRKAP